MIHISEVIKAAAQFLNEAYENEMNEDFGIGVGGMTGADQGIPEGGDCKAVVAKRMDGGRPATRWGKKLRRLKRRKKRVR